MKLRSSRVVNDFLILLALTDNSVSEMRPESKSVKAHDVKGHHIFEKGSDIVTLIWAYVKEQSALLHQPQI